MAHNHSFLNLVQHRFASHCCEALFLKSAPTITSELIAPMDAEQSSQNGDVYVSMENLFLHTCNELEGNLGYLMTDRFASHPLRVLLLVLSGMPLTVANSTSLVKSKKKEHVTVIDRSAASRTDDRETRAVPESFQEAIDKMMVGTVVGLDTTSLRALATHPIANPVLQLLLELEFTKSEKQSAKDPNSLLRALIPDDLLVENTESASFVNSLMYDTIGSRLLEVIITHAPGKMFKALYKCSFDDKLGNLAKNEVAAFVVIRMIERLNKDDLKTAVDQIAPHIETLIQRSRTSVIKTLIERCRIRQVDTQLIFNGLEQAYGTEASKRLINMLKVSETSADGMAEDRRKRLETEDSSKVHGSLLAQCMLESPGPLRELITDALLAIDSSKLIAMAKDRTASRVLQNALTSQDQNLKFKRIFIPRLYGHVGDLAIDPIAAYMIDCLWKATAGLKFIRERIADELAQNESSMRTSSPGRAVWRNWKMDVYRTSRKAWLNENSQDASTKSSIELARERFAAQRTSNRHRLPKVKTQHGTGSNSIPSKGAEIQSRA